MKTSSSGSGYPVKDNSGTTGKPKLTTMKNGSKSPLHMLSVKAYKYTYNASTSQDYQCFYCHKNCSKLRIINVLMPPGHQQMNDLEHKFKVTEYFRTESAVDVTCYNFINTKTETLLWLTRGYQHSLIAKCRMMSNATLIYVRHQDREVLTQG